MNDQGVAAALMTMAGVSHVFSMSVFILMESLGAKVANFVPHGIDCSKIVGLLVP